MSLFQSVSPTVLSSVVNLPELAQREHVEVEDIAQVLVYLIDKTQVDLSVRARAQFYQVGDKRVDLSVMPGYVQLNVWPATRTRQSNRPFREEQKIKPERPKNLNPRVTPSPPQKSVLSPESTINTNTFSALAIDEEEEEEANSTEIIPEQQNSDPELEYDDDSASSISSVSSHSHSDEQDDDDDDEDDREWSRKCILRKFDVATELKHTFDCIQEKLSGTEPFHWWLFSDSVQDPIWNLIGDFESNITKVIDEMTKHRWCHAYDPNYRLFVDLNQVLFEKGILGIRVMKATPKQHEHFEACKKEKEQKEQNGGSDEKQVWYVFENYADFNTWNFLATTDSMLQARELIKQKRLVWAHIYSPDQHRLFNIEVKDRHFWQRECSVGPAYLNRFEMFLKSQSK